MTDVCFLLNNVAFQNVKYSFLCPLANKVLCGCAVWYAGSKFTPRPYQGALMRHLK